MDNILLQQLHKFARGAQRAMARLTPQQKKRLEESWDIEHAYYSSALEGSNLDRKEFEDLAKAAQ